MKRYVTAALFGAVFSVVPTAANGATQADYNVAYCDGGTYVGVGTNNLSNGTVRSGWCKSGTGATTITVRYDKYSGSDVTVRFGYQWTNSSGGNVGGTNWDSTGWVTVRSGEIWGARFRRSPAEQPPNGQSCVQGLLQVSGQGTFETYTVCR